MSQRSTSPGMERRETEGSSRGPQAGLPSPPRPAWMWKPRSKLIDNDGNARHTTSLLQLRRIGAKTWNRRFVFLDHHLFCYGKDKGRKDKQVPFELIETVRRESAEKLRREHAPKEFAAFGWYLAVKGRTLLFCAESEESAEQWVTYLTALLCAMKGSPTGPLPGPSAGAANAFGDTSETQTPARGATLAELGAQYDEAHPHDEETHYGTLTTMTSPGDARSGETSLQTPSERPRRAQSSIAASFAAPPSGRPALPEADDAHSSQLAAAADLDRSSRSSTPPATRTSPPPRQLSVDAVEEKSDSSHDDASLLDVSSDDTEGEVRSDKEGDSDGEQPNPSRTTTTIATSHAASRTTLDAEDATPEQGSTDRPLPREVRYARFLLPLAADPHSHIGYRLPALEAYFKSGDDASSVVFSRTMEKVGKRDNAQAREVVLTTRHLYLFSKGGMTNSQQVRCIDTHDITGVVESTTDKTLMAVLIPTFHDVLLKVVPQNSCVPGTPPEVKQQLIAHLYKAHCDVHTDHRFLFRESATVAKEIRRTEEAKHPPLVVRAGDQMRVGERAALLDTFAKNADEAVYWSSMVRQVQADRKPRLCALVVTEGSIYSLSDTLQEVVRRTAMQDLLRVEYDRDAQSILLQCRGVDVLFNMQSSAEFDDFLRVLPAAMADGFGRSLRLTPSKQLYSHAKLFSFSTLNGAGPGGAAHAASRRHRGFLWPKGKKTGGGTKLLSSFAAAAAAASDDGDDGAAAAFHHSIQGDYRNSQAIRLFCAQFRFVEEVLQDYDDAVALWRQYEAAAGQPRWDTLRLRSTLATRMRVGEICLSAACRLLDAKECATLAKTSALELHESVVKAMGTPRAVCVTSEGFLFLRNGVAAAAAAAGAGGSGTASYTSSFAADGAAAPPVSTVRNKVKSRLSTAVSHISGVGGGAKDDDLVLGLVGWSAIAAVVRCHTKEGSSVALLTNRTHPADYLFHVDTAQAMLDVMAAAMGCYAQYRQGNPDLTHFLPLYTAPRVQNLAVALKKTVFDPFPTVALRYTPHSFPSDRLRMAYIPDVADACRRFGDNTIYFSGVAWRVRSATLRKCNGQLESDPGADMRRQNNHLYKSYIFVLTNVAVYHCTKGGFEVVRRTLLTDMKGITVGQHDPDTVLLSVPSEYDMYFRVEGRGAELVARLQEAYVEWTNYGHYLPYERQGTHNLEDYGLPVRQAPCVAALGTLTKPAYFNDLQSSRPAVECRHQTQQWHLRCLRRAIASFERAQAAARKGRHAAAGAANASPWSSWSRMRAALAERQSFLYFVQRRCFRFGLTSEDFDEMQRAQRLLRAYREMVASATALIAATSSTDPEVFKAALQRASAVPDLRLLVEEETRVYEGYLARRACLTAILGAVERYRHRPSGDNVSLVALETTVLDHLHEARRVGFSADYLRYVVHVVRVLVQRTQIQRMVCDPANRQRLSAMQDGGWVLVQQAAGEVGMTWRPPPSAAASSSSTPLARLQLTLRVAQQALKNAAATGEPLLIHGATTFAAATLDLWDESASLITAAAPIDGKTDVAVRGLRRAVEVLRKEDTPSRVEERQAFMRAVETLIDARQTHQRQQTWTPSLVSGMLDTCARLQEQVAAQPLLLYHGTQSVLAMEHAMLTEQRHRLRLQRALERREVKAQQQHERDLQQRKLATLRAAARRRRREATAQERRQRKALTLWSAQVDQLASSLDATLAAAETETDESIRLGIKRCVHLQRWIAEAGTRYGLAAAAGAFGSGAAATQRSTSPPARPANPPSSPSAAGEAKLAELLHKLQRVAARAQHLLDKRLRGGADHYGVTNSVTMEASTGVLYPISAGAANGASLDGEAGAVDAEGTAAIVLPPEVEQLIADLDTEGLVAYIQQHKGNAALHTMPTVLDKIQTEWQLARRRQRWVEGLHRRLHAAAVLHSCELLEEALQAADAADYTDAAVETARRAVAAMKRRRNGDDRGSDATQPSTSLAASDAIVDPWRRPRHTDAAAAAEESEEEEGSDGSRQSDDDERRVVKDDAVDAALPPVLRATEVVEPAEEGEEGEEAPQRPIVPDTIGERLQDDESLEASPAPLFSAGSQNTEETTDVVKVSAAQTHLAEVARAMEGVAEVSEAAPPALLNAGAVLRQLYAVTVAMVSAAVTPLSHAEAAAASRIRITDDNPFCAAYLQAWRAVLLHQVRPSGLLIKSPRSVWDVVREMGEMNHDGDYAAPYVTRLSADFCRLYRSTDDSDAARLRADAVLLALMFFSHRVECVVDGITQIGEKGRRELLLPTSLLAQPPVMRALLDAARLCDTLEWHFTNVQTLAMTCLFPRNGPVDVPAPQRFRRVSAAAEPSDSTPHTTAATRAEAPQKTADALSHKTAAVSVPSEPTRVRAVALSPPKALSRNSSLTSTPAAAATPTTPVSPAVAPAALRDECCARSLLHLQESVRCIASYFTQQLRAHGADAKNGHGAASYFDEHCCPEVGQLVETSVLPALVEVFSCGLLRRYQLVRTRTLWDVLTTIKEALSASSRTLAAAELLPIMDLTEALSDVSDAGGRYTAKLRSLSEEELHQLRVRMFLRECMNRSQLYPLLCTLFPSLNGNEVWVGQGSGLLWTLYDPDLCLLYPPNSGTSLQLRPLLEKLSALPFALIVDRELR